MEFLLVLIIAISLSMDAFSLSLAYGTLGIHKKQIYLLSIIVGLFHFFMPQIGLFIGNNFFNIVKINPQIITFLILTIIGLEMIYETFKEKEDKKLIKIRDLILFAFAVSIDSFSVGLTLTTINQNYILSSLIFALTSATFTFLGLKLGNKIKALIGKLSTVLGGTALIIIGIVYIL